MILLSSFHKRLQFLLFILRNDPYIPILNQCLVFLQVAKCFVSDQKFIYMLCQSQTFCVRQKDDLHSIKLFFFAGTTVFEEALNAVEFLC